MSLSELLPKVQALPRADKLRLIQMMVVDLAREEGVPLIEVGTPYPVWSPYHAFDAAAAMLKALDEEGARG
jgi:hypothetical protein